MHPAALVSPSPMLQGFHFFRENYEAQKRLQSRSRSSRRDCGAWFSPQAIAQGTKYVWEDWLEGPSGLESQVWSGGRSSWVRIMDDPEEPRHPGCRWMSPTHPRLT